MPATPAFTVSLDALQFFGRGLVRPECVLCTADGSVFTADWRGGVAWLRPDGRQQIITARLPDGVPSPKPNGIALLPDGSFLLADLSEDRAGVWRLFPDGCLEPFLVELDGAPLPPTNFVCLDRRGRVWITVSTRMRPRALDYRPTAASGFIVLVDEHGARVVADDLGYTNECKLDAREEWLYVNETFARRLTRFRIGADGSLGTPEPVATFGPGMFPDGLAFDAEGGIWVTSIVSNRVVRIAPNRTQTLVLEDVDRHHLAVVEEAFREGRMGRPHLDDIRSRRLRSVSSLAFGGEDLRTVYLGCLLGDRLATFRSPAPGLPPVHWDYSVPAFF